MQKFAMDYAIKRSLEIYIYGVNQIAIGTIFSNLIEIL